MKNRIVKKMAEILRTDIDGIIPALEKLKKEIREQEEEIKRIKKKI